MLLVPRTLVDKASALRPQISAPSQLKILGSVRNRIGVTRSLVIETPSLVQILATDVVRLGVLIPNYSKNNSNQRIKPKKLENP
jgi:hypothetical protein